MLLLHQYRLVREVVQVRQLHSRLVQKYPLVHRLVLRLLLLHPLVYVHSPHLRVPVYLRPRPFLWVLVRRWLLSLLLVPLVQVPQTRRLILLVDILLLVVVIHSAHTLQSSLMFFDWFEFNYWSNSLTIYLGSSIFYFTRIYTFHLSLTSTDYIWSILSSHHTFIRLDFNKPPFYVD